MSQLIIATIFSLSIFSLSLLSDLEKESSQLSIVKDKDISFVQKHSQHHAKPGGVVLVEVHQTSKSSSGDQTFFSLEGVIKINRDLPHFQYQWILPDDLQVSQGQQSSHLGSVKKGEEVRASITLLSSTTKDQQVFLRAFSETPSGRLGYTASFILSQKESKKLDSQSLHPNSSSSQKLKGLGTKKKIKIIQ